MRSLEQQNLNAADARNTSLDVETIASFPMVNMRSRQIQSPAKLPPVALSPALAEAIAEMHRRDYAANAAESEARDAAGEVLAAQQADKAAALAAAERDEPAPTATDWPLQVAARDIARGADARYALAVKAASKVREPAEAEPLRPTLDAYAAAVATCRDLPALRWPCGAARGGVGRLADG